MKQDCATGEKQKGDLVDHLLTLLRLLCRHQRPAFRFGTLDCLLMLPSDVAHLLVHDRFPSLVDRELQISVTANYAVDLIHCFQLRNDIRKIIAQNLQAVILRDKFQQMLPLKHIHPRLLRENK